MKRAILAALLGIGKAAHRRVINSYFYMEALGKSSRHKRIHLLWNHKIANEIMFQLTGVAVPKIEVGTNEDYLIK